MDAMADLNFLIMVTVGLSLIGLAVFSFCQEQKEAARRRRELELHHYRQMIEWNAQLSRNDWLRTLLNVREEDIFTDVAITDEIVDRILENVKYTGSHKEQVNWRREGF
jgi:hypothetical protein